jgi:hypothetical protein
VNKNTKPLTKTNPHTHTHTQTHTHTHTHMHVYKRRAFCSEMRTGEIIYEYCCVCVCARAREFVYGCVCVSRIYMCVLKIYSVPAMCMEYGRTHTHTHTHTHTGNTHTQTHTHTHTHTQRTGHMHGVWQVCPCNTRVVELSL